MMAIHKYFLGSGVKSNLIALNRSTDPKNVPFVIELRRKWMEYQQLPESARGKLRSESPDTYKDADLN